MSLQLPSSLLCSLKGIKGFDEAAFVQAHKSGEQITSLRVNPGKTGVAQLPILTSLAHHIPWSSHGYYLSSRPSFTTDPLFHAGAYYVQEASSMFLEEVLKQTADLARPLCVLDLCASPGGKSTLIQSLISGESLLVSNEVIKARSNILSENLTKWGAANVVVTNNDPKDFQRLEAFFDIIVVDAPCSGSGLFRKDPEAIVEWSLNNVELCSQRQQRILSDVLPALKPGGFLIYSTCSYSECENEGISDWLLSGAWDLSGIPLKIKPEWNIRETRSPRHNGYGYRFYPDKLKGEGFFVAAYKKTGYNNIGAAKKTILSRSRQKPSLIDKQSMDILAPWIDSPGRFSFITWKGNILAFPAPLIDYLMAIQSVLYIKKAGIRIGTIIRDQFIPHHEFALSNIMRETIPSIDIDILNALQYLRRNDVFIETKMQGWVLIKYENLALGWIKIMPGRINNYYPKEWRILNK